MMNLEQMMDDAMRMLEAQIVTLSNRRDELAGSRSEAQIRIASNLLDAQQIAEVGSIAHKLNEDIARIDRVKTRLVTAYNEAMKAKYDV